MMKRPRPCRSRCPLLQLTTNNSSTSTSSSSSSSVLQSSTSSSGQAQVVPSRDTGQFCCTQSVHRSAPFRA